MAEFRTTIDAQTGQSGSAQAVLGQHTLDSLLDGEFRTLLHQGAIGNLFQAASPAGMVTIKLLSQLVASQHSLVRIDDDNEIAAVNMRGVLGLGLAAQQISGGDSGLAQRLASCIQDVPFAFQVALLCHISGHIQNLHCSYETNYVKTKYTPVCGQKVPSANQRI